MYYQVQVFFNSATWLPMSCIIL